MTEPPARALVCGFGRTGRAVARVLASHGVAVRVTDRATAAALGVDPGEWPGMELLLGEQAPDVLAGVDLVVPSPGVPGCDPVLSAAVTRGIVVASEIEVAFGFLACPLVAITGTNGKSTTTTLVGLAFEAAGRRPFVGGNLGTPLVTAADGDFDVAVAEVSSFQLEWTRRFRPVAAAVLNVTPDHLDRHASFAEYRELKGRLFAAQQATDLAVANRDDADALALGRAAPGRLVTFGREPVAHGAFATATGVAVRLGDGEERYDLGRTRLLGEHNRENVMAAALLARSLDVPPAALQHAIDTMEPLPHRLALVAERRGVRWYDDSKATNVGAAAKSLASLSGPLVLLAGGVDKGGDYAPLAAAACGKTRFALLFGAAAERIAAALTAAGVPVRTVTTLAAAVEGAAAVASRGDAVVLAPACSSFDMFTDYAARGRAFRAAVEGLG
jgi:UDP-N-acetylmuramoylalanine--D-glutamate ligase